MLLQGRLAFADIFACWCARERGVSNTAKFQRTVSNPATMAFGLIFPGAFSFRACPCLRQYRVNDFPFLGIRFSPFPALGPRHQLLHFVHHVVFLDLGQHHHFHIFCACLFFTEKVRRLACGETTSEKSLASKSSSRAW
jgi:hypothetical protein